jgi:hypothetical protein
VDVRRASAFDASPIIKPSLETPVPSTLATMVPSSWKAISPALLKIPVVASPIKEIEGAAVEPVGT